MFKSSVKNLKVILLAVILIFNVILLPNKAGAAEPLFTSTNINMIIDKQQCYTNDIVTVSISSDAEANIKGVQFQINYDPSVLSMQGSNITPQGKYELISSGVTVDKVNGILIYPLINSTTGTANSSKAIAKVSFKAIKASTTDIKLSNIKAVDSGLNVVNYNNDDKKSITIINAPVTPPSGGGGGGTPPAEVVIPVSTTVDNNFNVSATIDSSKIDKNTKNIIKVDEPKSESKIQVQIPSSAIGTGTGSFQIQTGSVSLDIPTGVIDSNLISNGQTLRVTKSLMSAADASVLLANIPQGAKTNGKVFTFGMAIYDSNNNVVTEIHNFASNKSVTVTINLTNDDIKGMDTSKISAFYFDAASNKWVDLGGSFDAAKMTYTFNTTHFTNFTIMQKPASAALAAPIGLTAAASTTAIKLNWTASAGASGYYLYRSTALDGTYIRLSEKLITTNSYSDKGFVSGTIYYYKVTAVNPEGLESDKSLCAEAAALSPAVTVKRLSGTDRIETSIAIAMEQYNDKKPDAVVLVTANDFPDALSGSELAYKYNAPMLLTYKSVNESRKVLDYIINNLSKGKNIYVLGGTGAVSLEVSDYLSAQGYNIVRLGGKDRYETNQKIVDYLNTPKNTSLVITTGDDFADALSVSSIADINGFPILLNGKDNISTNVSNYLTNIMPTTVYLIGGTGVLSTNIETQIKKLNGNINIVRLGGIDRYETSMKIAEYFNLNTTTITLATGTNFPDALSGSVLAAKQNASILLADNKDITKQKGLIDKQNIYNIILFGGEGVISKTIADSLLNK